MKDLGYTVWACAILSNHVHLLVRRHRDDAITMWDEFAQKSRVALCAFPDVDDDHPIWADRRYKVFLYDPSEVFGRIDYIAENFDKAGLPRERYTFVSPYNGWPHPKPQR